MDGFQIVATLLTVAALFSYLNHRFLRLPAAIGLLLIGLIASLGLIALGTALPGLEHRAVLLLERIDFDRTLMDGLLGFLLFAGALHVNLDDLAREKGVIGLLASLGLVLSTIGWRGRRGLAVDTLDVVTRPDSPSRWTLPITALRVTPPAKRAAI